MYEYLGWNFPDIETHFPQMLKKNMDKGGPAEYQLPVRDRSIGFCKNRGMALDIGANIGLWSRDLCRHFNRVIAFEPVSEFRECLARNVPMSNLDIRPVALGSIDTMIDMIITAENTGHSHVDPHSMGRGMIPMVTLDSLSLGPIDYIKIDCEGYEQNILLGAKHTILHNRPIIVIEDKKHKDVGHADTEMGVATLVSWGAKILTRVNDDVIIGW